MKKRVLLKLSGESLQGNQQYGIDTERLLQYAKDIEEAYKQGFEIAIVFGGGNIFRGLKGASQGFDRVKGDQMGMLATTINALAIQSALESLGLPTVLLTAIGMSPIGSVFSKPVALEALRSGKIVILAGGTGNPYFTTDTASALRAIEIEADILLKGTRVDGIYTADPEKDKNAVKFTTLSYQEALDKKLKVMDATAFTLCQENAMPILVFDMNKQGNLYKVLLNSQIGTLVS